MTAEKVGRITLDYSMLALLTLLLGIGLATLFSASYYVGSVHYNNPQYLFVRQLVFAAIGLLVAFGLAHISLDLVRRAIPLLLVWAHLLLMLVTFVPGLSVEVLGARRWLRFFGYSFQPSELVKLVLVLYLAHFLAKKRERIDDLKNTILPPLLVALVFTALVYLQNDFSTAFFILFLDACHVFCRANSNSPFRSSVRDPDTALGLPALYEGAPGCPVSCVLGSRTRSPRARVPGCCVAGGSHPRRTAGKRVRQGNKQIGGAARGADRLRPRGAR